MLEATTRGSVLFTFNIGDFVHLSREYPEHGGIILAHQREWTLPTLITALDRLLAEAEANMWIGQIRWLNDWLRS